MAEPPKLTASQAALLRLRGGRNDLRDTVELARLGHLDGMGVRITGQGRAALAAYDAEQRRAIRVEAMRECFKAVYVLDVDSRQAIEDLIAKEESNG